MSNEARVRQNFLGGIVENNPLAAADTILTSSSMSYMVAVGTTQHLPVVLDPDGIFGEPEIAYVTAHGLGATTATLLRGQEGSTARQHNRDTPWLHGATTTDFALSGTMLPPWTAPTLLNGWTNFGSDGGGTYTTAGYYLGPDGVIHLRGLIQAGTLTAGTQLFVLPVGFRPNLNWILPVWATASGVRVNVYGTTAPTVGSGATVSGPGSVNLQSPGSLGGGGLISLDIASFRQDG